MTEANIPGFADRLRTLRQSLGLTQVEFADLTGISRGYIATMERGVRNPSIRVFYMLRKRFNLSVDAILDSIDPETITGE